MRIAGLYASIILLASALLAGGCEKPTTMVCFPGLYRCGGQDGDLVQYCDTTTKRWETLRSCEERGQLCVSGSCVFPEDGDIDIEAEEEAELERHHACIDDFDCPEDLICIDCPRVLGCFGRVCEEALGRRFDIVAKGSRLIYRNDTGRISIYGDDGRWILREGFARISFDPGEGNGEEASFLTTASDRGRSCSQKQEGGLFGEADTVHVLVEGVEGEPDLHWFVTGYRTEGFYTFQVRVANPGLEAIPLESTEALAVEAATGGGLYIGRDPARHRILENGAGGAGDFSVKILPGDGDDVSISGANHLIMDLESASVWTAGSLSFLASSPVMKVSGAPGAPDPADGRLGFSLFSAEAVYKPSPKIIEPGTTFASETYYVHPAESNPFEALERYAFAVKEKTGLTLWTEKRASYRVPNGWNSLAAYGDDLDESAILENLEVMALEFGDWGLDWFQVDDGWEEALSARGPEWLAGEIRASGLLPGLWMNPDDPIELEGILNLFNSSGGYKWLKLDAATIPFLANQYGKPGQTVEEAYREGLGIVRDWIGEDVFILADGLTGSHIGLVDGSRVNTRTAPVWDDPEDPTAGELGMKAATRDIARRYYLHNRVWSNNPGAIFLHPDLDDPERPSFSETVAFASVIGLSGGIVEIGDRPVELGPSEINTVRKLLPTQGHGARPLDMFERAYPEIWHLKVEKPAGVFDQSYDILGLFNWGANADLTADSTGGGEIPDTMEEKEFALDLRGIGLSYDRPYHAYEFWTGEYLGLVREKLGHTVPAHSARVIALRPVLDDRPQFIGWNRHISMGGAGLIASEWDEEFLTLTVRMKVAEATPTAPFTYRLLFFFPGGLALDELVYYGDAFGWHREDDPVEVVGGLLYTIEFIPDKTDDSAFFVMSFDRVQQP